MTREEYGQRYRNLIAIVREILEREHALAANEGVQKNEPGCSEPNREEPT